MKMSRTDAYRYAAPIYDWVIEPFLVPIRKKTEALLAKRTAAESGLRVLEVACGTGSQARRLAEDGRRIVALDRSFAMLSEAAKKAGESGDGLWQVAGNAAALPFADGVFDAVVVQLALHEMPGPVRSETLTEMLRVAGSGAHFLAADFLPTIGVSVSSLMITAAELAAGKRHYSNGRLFVKEGGITALLSGFGLEIIETWPFFGGNIGLVLARKPG
jgi:demethylmenaquinone methyltransferase/2-methoxy-6-polyprenyl-1,4-benzoquinol methylase